MSESEDSYICAVEIRNPPLLFSTALAVIGHRLFGRVAPPWTIDWKETMVDLLARFMVGLVIGLGLCILLVPTLFWAGRTTKQGRGVSLFEYWGEPFWIGWLFLGVLIGPGILWALTTRANVLLPDEKRIRQAESPEEKHDSVSLIP